jgi:YVTN family beta-propeller protein
MKNWRVLLTALNVGVVLSFASFGQQPAAARKQPPPPPPGVTTPGVRRDMASIQPQASFSVEGAPDWMVVTEDAIWVTSSPKSTVTRLDPKTNTVAATVTVGKRPCSGLTAGFGTVWVPNCGDKTVSRIDMKTNQVTATLPVGPAQSEGLIAVSSDAFWMVSGNGEKLLRIDPKNNQVAAEITVAEGSASCIFADEAIWVINSEKSTVTRVDSKTNKVTETIPVGPKPRFATAGANSVWTLNQGDGTVSRIDTKTHKVIATVEAGIPGEGGEIAFGDNHVWATLFQAPITEIDAAANKVVRQWFGPGGDSIRVAFGAIWLCNLRQQTVWRIDLAGLK